MTGDEIEEHLLTAADTAAQRLPVLERLFVAALINRIRELAELRRGERIATDRALAELYGRVEALEGARK